MLCRLFYFIYSGSYVVINDALAILVFIYTVCASEFDPGTSTVSTETQILRGLVVTVKLYILCSKKFYNKNIFNIISAGQIRPRGGEGIRAQWPNRGGTPLPLWGCRILVGEGLLLPLCPLRGKGSPPSLCSPLLPRKPIYTRGFPPYVT